MCLLHVILPRCPQSNGFMTRHLDLTNSSLEIPLPFHTRNNIEKRATHFLGIPKNPLVFQYQGFLGDLMIEGSLIPTTPQVPQQIGTSHHPNHAQSISKSLVYFAYLGEETPAIMIQVGCTSCFRLRKKRNM